MTKPSDERIENIIGGMLRVGVILSSALVAAGGVLYLAQSGREAPRFGAFRGEPSSITGLSGILRGAAALDPRSCIQLGLLLLIATPVARVLFSIAAFAAQRDGVYVGITVIVAAILLYGLFAVHS